MLPAFRQDTTPAAPASRDAKSCVSRADTAYFHRHTSAPQYRAKLLVRRKILRLYFICTHFHWQTSTQPYRAKLTRETQDFASLLYLHTLSLANIRAAISHNVPSGDAKSCVSTLFVHTFIGKHTRCHIAQSSLVRRKILRLYFICTYFHWHTYALPYRAKLTRETQDFASLLYLHTLSLEYIHTAISHKLPCETQNLASLLLQYTKINKTRRQRINPLESTHKKPYCTQSY